MSADYRIAQLLDTTPALKLLETLCDNPDFRVEMRRLGLDDIAQRREEKLVRTYRTTDLSKVLRQKMTEPKATNERVVRFRQEHTLVSLMADTIALLEAALSKVTNTTDDFEEIVLLLEFIHSHVILLVRHTQLFCKEDAKPDAVTQIAHAPDRAIMTSLDTKSMEYIADRLTALIERYLAISFRRSIDDIQKSIKASEPTEIINQPQGKLAAWFSKFTSGNKIDVPPTRRLEPAPINISALIQDTHELQLLMGLLLTTMWRNPELSLTTHLNEMDAIVSKKLHGAK